jgi:inositol-phosphate phosphatase/L-galactose 1-phosphate phosphatase/histidinol-phosphatase
MPGDPSADINDIDDIIDLAGRLADAARPVTLARFRSGIQHDTKSDASPVTEADRESERVMRTMIEAERPSDGIFGEEFGVTNPDADTVWILDPIDGTKAFITGKPVYGTLIGVVRNGVAIVGVIDSPATDDRWIGASGRPAKFNGKAIETRKGRAFKDAWVTATSHTMFASENIGKFEALTAATQHTTYGSECQGYGFLACGWLDIVCEDTLAPYDYAALIPIVEGAGGIITDWNGDALKFSSGPDSKSISVLAAADKNLHAEAVKILCDSSNQDMNEL